MSENVNLANPPGIFNPVTSTPQKSLTSSNVAPQPATEKEKNEEDSDDDTETISSWELERKDKVISVINCLIL